ncbi:hypothetical protein BRC81_11230 [Halobacteriales archaeon QS_1_68_20]|nr:MAG: hypothetical protein BRC81_11230 [Halobacteriales archaeon QS_1_68_20]
MSHTEYWEEISELAQRAGTAREEFVPPENPPAEERAIDLLRNGLGPTIMVYVDARTGEWVRFPPVEHSLLEQTLNDFLELYARCYGYEIDAEFTVREAAETLLETNNVKDTAQLLTGIPPREEMPDAWSGERTD